VEVIIQPTPETASAIAARIVARLLRDKPNAVLGIGTDGDGQDNQSEFIAGTIPTDSASVFRAMILPFGDGFTITWPSVPGIPYIVEWTPALANGWQPISTVTGAASPAVTTSFTDTGASGATQRFYRVHIP
jgi:hypothetical protein